MKYTQKGVHTRLKVKDYPIEECLRTVSPYVEAGMTFHQKFTCCRCQSRQTILDPNVFHTTAFCEVCGTLTDIEVQGCNYLLIGTFRKS